MKTKISNLFRGLMLAFTLATIVHAQTGAGSGTAIGETTPAPAVPDPLSGLALLIPIVSPLLVAGAKKIADKLDAEIPGWLLPPLCTLFGVGLSALQGYATGGIHGSTLLAGLVLGGAGSFVREFQDQMKQAAGGTAPPVAAKALVLLCLILPLGGLGLTGCTAAQMQAAKPTAISLAQPAGYEVARLAIQQWPTKAPAIIADVRALLSGALTTGALIAPANLTAWENAEASKLGLSAADVGILDNLMQTGVVALQGQYQADLKSGIGVTATAILTNFETGLTQATQVGPMPVIPPATGIVLPAAGG